ncbi:MAG: hypothetical protein Q9165_003901 [Trypethelium subeluteriae]
MPARSDWRLQREGFTADTLGRLLKRTVLNPVLTLPLLLLARYSQTGRQLASYHETAYKRLRTVLVLGLFLHVSDALDRLVVNNWTSDKYDWSKEIVVVTGGSDGIGKIIVQLLAERGIKVAVLDIQPPTYEVPPTVSFFPCDLTSPTAINKSANLIRTTLGSPTILINNAGLTRSKPLLSLTPTDLRLTFGVNTLSHYHLAQQFLPYMIQSNHGMVVTIASTAAYLTAPHMVDYAASKAGALAFHEGLAAELYSVYRAPRVRTVLVAQGYTKTKLFEGFDPGDGFVTYALEPETVAEAVVRKVLSGKGGYVWLPEQSAKLFCVPVRGWPVWMQMGFRKGLVGLMKGFRGRAVVQPSEVEEVGGEGKEKVLGESVASI